MSRNLPFNRKSVAISHDAVMAAVSFLLAVYLRLGDWTLTLSAPYLLTGCLLLSIICVIVCFSMQLYRGLWRYASMKDMVTIVKVATLSLMIFFLLMFVAIRLQNVPRSVFFINWMLLLVLLGAPRFLYRALKDGTLHKQMPKSRSRLPVLLIGAGDQAEQFIRDMERNAHAIYQVVGLVDDEPKRKNHAIHRVPIYGGSDILEIIVRKLERKGCRPVKMILTDETASGEQVRFLLETADRLGVPLARLPKLSEIKHTINDKPDIRPIAVEDLLGRSQNILDRNSMRNLVEGRKVLVTGAGGTIGGELTRQIASYKPNELILLELSEFNLYQIEREIRDSFPELKLSVVLNDVRAGRHVDAVFSQHRPQLVFHAAAIKHVPIAEFNIEEAVLTNVFGTRNLAEASKKHGVQVMVMISTDKAVNPTNVMGASKRLAESFCQALGADSGTKFITVRFGNVLGSAGSVVPLFQEQLAKGGPITVTHPDMTRYFMTVREAVELVLQACVLGVSMEKHAYIFVLDMGQPVPIVDLARQMIRLAGLRVDEDIKIIYTGLRPGEKLYEELFHFSENAVKTSHESIFLASPRACEMDELKRGLEPLFNACSDRKTAEALELLKLLVPEFTHAPR